MMSRTTPVVDLRLGDCRDVMAGMEPNSVYTIITDPPYGLEFMGKDWDHGVPGVAFWKAALRVAKPGAVMLAFGGTRTHHRLMVAIEDAEWEIRDVMMWLYGSGFNKVGLWQNNKAFRRLGIADEWEGYGGSLKPAWEPIIVAMKPRDGTFANNALEWGVAGLWIDGARVATGEYLGRPKGQERTTYNRSNYPEKMLGQITAEPSGRWPANLILDAEAGAMLDEQSGDVGGGFGTENRAESQGRYGNYSGATKGKTVGFGDSGGASRFFYCAKAPKRERWFYCAICDDAYPVSQLDDHDHGIPPREREHIICHPTQKPLSLMKYLCNLTRTPTGGMVLDPFMGTGSTGEACIETGRDFIGIDNERPSYITAKRRLEIEEPEEPPQEPEAPDTGQLDFLSLIGGET